MKRKALALVIPFFLAGLIPAAPRGRLAVPLQSAAPAPGSYPDTAEGLQQFLQELLAAIKSGQWERVSVFIKSLIIPDHAASLTKVFGPEEGKNLAPRYETELSDFERNNRKHFEFAAKEGSGTVDVSRFLNPADAGPSSISGAALAAMKEPLPLYSASVERPNSPYGITLDYYVFINGGFRLLGTSVLAQLSNAPPLRVRVGGQVQSKKIISQPRPRYPQEAKDRRIQGTVRMQAVISTDGRVAELTVLSGDTILAVAATEAARQWRYQPTLLNGRPVEVVTTIDVIFTLR